jgi:uncharacterized repeat protein (TIGR01451 family)
MFMKTKFQKTASALAFCAAVFSAAWLVSFAGAAPAAAALQAATRTPMPTAVPGVSVVVEKSVEGALTYDENANGLVDPGDTVRYEIVFRNSGTDALTGIVVVSNYDQDAVQSIANAVPAGNDDKDKITWNFDQLAAGNILSIAFEATLKRNFQPEGSQAVENTFEFSCAQEIAVSTRQTVTVRVPDLSINKKWELKRDLNADGQPGPGDTLSYTVTVQNTGEVEATDIIVEDDYDPYLSIQASSIKDGGVDNGNAIRWLYDRLDPEMQIAITYDAVLNSVFPIGKTSINNTVHVSAKGTNPVEFTTEAFAVSVIPTPTVTPTGEPTDILPTSTAVSPSAGPTTQGLQPEHLALLGYGLIFLALAGVLVFSFLIYKGREISGALRDAFVLALIMGTVIILGLAGSVDRAAIAGLIGTVAGYVLKSASSVGEPSGRKNNPPAEEGGKPAGGGERPAEKEIAPQPEPGGTKTAKGEIPSGQVGPAAGGNKSLPDQGPEKSKNSRQLKTLPKKKLK